MSDLGEKFREKMSDKKFSRKIIIIGIMAFILLIAILSILSIPSKKQIAQQKMDNFAKTAIQNKNSGKTGATVSNTRESGGFAMADITEDGNKGVAVYKVNSDESLTMIAAGSSFSQITLLNLGLSFEVQAKLQNVSVDEIIKNLENSCQYGGGNTPGYMGWNGIQTNGTYSFDTSAVAQTSNKLSAAVENTNTAQSAASDKTICVAVVPTDNAQVVNPNVNVVTSFQVQFITAGGGITTHALTYSVDMNFNVTITLDGKAL